MKGILLTPEKAYRTMTFQRRNDLERGANLDSEPVSNNKVHVA